MKIRSKLVAEWQVWPVLGRAVCGVEYRRKCMFVLDAGGSGT